MNLEPKITKETVQIRKREQQIQQERRGGGKAGVNIRKFPWYEKVQVEQVVKQDLITYEMSERKREPKRAHPQNDKHKNFVYFSVDVQWMHSICELCYHINSFVLKYEWK